MYVGTDESVPLLAMAGGQKDESRKITRKEEDEMNNNLPINAFRGEILNAIRENGVVVITA